MKLAAHAGLQQGATGQSVAHDGEQQGQQPEHGEEQRQDYVQPVFRSLHVEEAKAPGALDLVAPPRQRQDGHQGGERPSETQQPFHVVGSQHGGVEDGPGDPDAALHRHDTPQEQGAQAEEHQARPEGAAHDAVRVKRFPLLLRAVDKHHHGAVDQVTQQVGDHQAAGEQQEGRPGLAADALVGFDQDEDGEAVGEDAHGHGDDGGRDGVLALVVAAAVGLGALIGRHGGKWNLKERG